MARIERREAGRNGGVIKGESVGPIVSSASRPLGDERPFDGCGDVRTEESLIQVERISLTHIRRGVRPTRWVPGPFNGYRCHIRKLLEFRADPPLREPALECSA